VPTFPRSVANFTQRNREVYERAAFGVRVGYETPRGLGADGFLYPASERARDTSAAVRRLAAREEAAKAAADLYVLVERGAYGNLTLADPTGFEVTAPSGRLLPGAHIAGSVRHYGVPSLTDIYVIVIDGRFLKIRATYPEQPGGHAARVEVRTFAAGLAAALDAIGVER
jgi:hypothetical protein